MAKVNNTNIYNYDTFIDDRDYLLGTDWNNARKTKNFKLEHLRYFILQGLDPSNNGFITTTGYILEDNVLTINAGWVWQLNGLLCTNEEAIVITLEYTAEGFVRTDSIYANSNGEFLAISGPESETIAIPPQIPINTLLAFSINVFDTSIVLGEESVMGSIYVKKSFAKDFQFNGSGSNAVIPLNPEGYSDIKLVNSGLVSVSGIDLSLMTGPNFEAPYQGKPFVIWNKTGVDVTLKHDDTSNADYVFQLNDALDIIIPNNNYVSFYYDGALWELDKSWVEASEILTETNLGAFSNGLTTNDAIVDADLINYTDVSDTNKQKKTTWSNIKAKLKTYFDTLYQTTLVSGTNIKTINGTSILGSGNLVVSGGGVESVTGDSVDNTDVLNPIINAIPLSGTTTGNPVSGDIVINGDSSMRTDIFTGVFVSSNDDLVRLVRNDYQIILDASQYITIDAPVTSKGLHGAHDYSPNITDLEYVQKIYVDEKLVTNPTVTGTYNIDWKNDVWDLILTGNTVLTQSNLPESGKTKTISLNVTGNFTITYPAGWSTFITGAYSGTATLNTITIQYYGAGKYKVLIVQPT